MIRVEQAARVADLPAPVMRSYVAVRAECEALITAAGLPVEADHVIGDLIARGDAAKVPVPKLRTAYTHLKAYEKQRG